MKYLSERECAVPKRGVKKHDGTLIAHAKVLDGLEKFDYLNAFVEKNLISSDTQSPRQTFRICKDTKDVVTTIYGLNHDYESIISEVEAENKAAENKNGVFA